MRHVAWGLLLSLAATAHAKEAHEPEEVAALLLSPQEKRRERGRKAFLRSDSVAFLRAVLVHVERRGHDREAWILELQEGRKEATGLELKRIATLLQHLLPAPDAILNVETCCAVVPRELARKILGTEPTAKSPTCIWPTDERLRLCLAWIDKDPACRIYLSRRIASSDRSPIRVASKQLVSYVEDVEIADDGIADPVVAMIEAGAELGLRPVLSQDARYVTLEVHAEIADLERPIKVVEKRVPPPLNLRIQVPVLHTAEVKTTVTLPIGGHCILSMPTGKDRVALVFLRAAIGGAAIPLPRERTRGEPKKNR